MPKRLTETQRAAVEFLYKKGATYRDIAATLGIAQSSVTTLLKASGVALRGGVHFTPELRARVVALYRDGGSVLDIMAATGVASAQSVYRILRAEGVTERRRAPKRPRRPKC